MTSVPSLRQRSNGNKRCTATLLFAFLLISAQPVFSQLDLGIRLYEVADYTEALKRFRSADGPTARLYEARTYFKLGENDLALKSLDGLNPSLSTPLGAEIAYTRAVILYASGRQDQAITELESIKGRHNEATEWLASIQAYRAVRPDHAAPYIAAPRGTILTVGVLLPSEPRTSRAFPVVQGLVQGILVAVDEFNERSPDLKLRMVFAQTGSDAATAFEGLRNGHNPAFVIGPLRSEEVPSVAFLAEKHRIPLFIPLANGYTLKEANPYVFRFNPTVDDAGVRMADAAYRTLGLRRIAVFTHPDVEATDDASAFMRAFERMGGRIVMSISDASFTDLRHTQRRMDTLVVRRPSLPDSVRVDAVYLPVTGKEANTVLDNILTAIDTRRVPVIILGNEEMGYLDHSSARLQRLPTYHTSLLDVSPKADRIEQFRNRYLARASMDPNDFAYVGYDLATSVFESLAEVQHPVLLPRHLTQKPVFRGLTSQYLFQGARENRWVPVYRLTEDGPVELTSQP